MHSGDSKILSITEENRTSKKKPFTNIKTAAHILQLKTFRLSDIGCVIMNVPMPNPKAISIADIQNLSISPGDVLIAARNNSNNPRYEYIPSQNSDGTGAKVFQAVEIKEHVVGIVERVEGSRVIMRHEFVTENNDVGWPKPGGAVKKVVAYDNDFVNEKATEDLAKEKKKTEGGPWV